MCLVDFESGAFFSGTAIFLHEWVGSAIESGKMVEKQGLSSAIYFARRKSAKLNRADSECASTRKRKRHAVGFQRMSLPIVANVEDSSPNLTPWCAPVQSGYAVCIKISVVSSIFGTHTLPRAFQLFMPQCFDRIQSRRFSCRVIACCDPNYKTNHKTTDHPIPRNDKSTAEEQTDNVADEDSKPNPENPSQLCDHARFGQKLEHDMPIGRAQCLSQANFLRAFRHGDQHDIHQADRGTEQRDQRDQGRRPSEVTQILHEIAENRLHLDDPEVLILARLQLSHTPHESHRFIAVVLELVDVCR